MRFVLLLSAFFIGGLALAAEQKVLNKSSQEVNKSYENDAEFRVDDQSTLVGRVDTRKDLVLWVNDHSKVRLEGSARRVVIQCLEGGSTVDLRAFDCEQVVFENALTNNSSAFVQAREKIEFTEKIDDKSTAYVRAPKVKGPMLKGESRVIYAGPTPDFKKIDGGATTEAMEW